MWFGQQYPQNMQQKENASLIPSPRLLPWPLDQPLPYAYTIAI